MTHREVRTSGVAFVDTPKGMFTAAGVWFHATRKDIESYAGPLLDHEPLERLIGQAETWLRSPQTLVLWAFPLLMTFMGALPAAVAVLVTFVGWSALGPSFVVRPLEWLFRVLEPTWLQGVWYVGMLSGLAFMERYMAVWVGLGGFIALRWGFVEKLVVIPVRAMQRALYRLPVPDQVLRACIVRAAMKHRTDLPQLEELERHIAGKFSRKRSG